MAVGQQLFRRIAIQPRTLQISLLLRVFEVCFVATPAQGNVLELEVRVDSAAAVLMDITCQTPSCLLLHKHP